VAGGGRSALDGSGSASGGLFGSTAGGAKAFTGFGGIYSAKTGGATLADLKTQVKTTIADAVTSAASATTSIPSQPTEREPLQEHATLRLICRLRGQHAQHGDYNWRCHTIAAAGAAGTAGAAGRSEYLAQQQYTHSSSRDGRSGGQERAGRLQHC
jgi:hypothetical protein